jgi:tetratricopeptide (TPR) repeat protein
MDYWNATAQSKWADAIVVMTDSIERFPDDIDPEGPALLGHAYLAIDMPDEASRWFDRAVEIDAQHPMTRSAPLYLNYYLQQNEDDNGRLARKLLDDGIDPRLGSREIAHIVAIENAAKSGRDDAVLDALDNLYPNLFDDPPQDLEAIPEATFIAGWALIQSGDVKRGSHLMQAYLDWLERYEEVYGMNRRSISGRLLLGDTEGALDKLAKFVPLQGLPYISRLRMERSSIYDAIRDEPAFVAILDEYRENAAEQRRLLQAMNTDTSVQ